MIRTPRRRTRKAFTLIEIMLVAAITVLLAATMAPRMVGAYRNLELLGGVRELTSTCQLAATTAIRQRSEVRLVFMDGGGEYWLETFDAAQNKTTGMLLKLRPMGERRALARGVTLNMQSATDVPDESERRRYVAFRPDGSSSAATVRLMDRHGRSRWLSFGSGLGRAEISNKPPVASG